MSDPRLGAANACFPPPNACVPKGSASLTISTVGVTFLKGKEGFVGHLYNDTAGHCTIGYGHLVHHGKCDDQQSEAEFKDGITRDQAAGLASVNLSKYVNAVRYNVDVELTQYEFDALVSFTYNLGPNILPGSALLRHVNAGEWNLVTASLMEYVKARNPKTGKREFSQGLANRRADEARLFLYGMY